MTFITSYSASEICGSLFIGIVPPKSYTCSKISIAVWQENVKSQTQKKHRKTPRIDHCSQIHGVFSILIFQCSIILFIIIIFVYSVIVVKHIF